MKTVRFTEAGKESHMETKNAFFGSGFGQFGEFVDRTFRNGIDVKPEGKNFICRDITDDTIYSGTVDDAQFQIPDDVATDWINSGLLEEVV